MLPYKDLSFKALSLILAFVCTSLNTRVSKTSGSYFLWWAKNIWAIGRGLLRYSCHQSLVGNNNPMVIMPFSPCELPFEISLSKEKPIAHSCDWNGLQVIHIRSATTMLRGSKRVPRTNNALRDSNMPNERTSEIPLSGGDYKIGLDPIKGDEWNICLMDLDRKYFGSHLSILSYDFI